MAIGDRVLVGNGSIWDNSVTVAVYEPLWQPNGELQVDRTGNASIKMIGGVKGGTYGTIAGDPIKVYRSQLYGENKGEIFAGADLISVYPVQLDQYMKTGWLANHHIRVVGGEARNPV